MTSCPFLGNALTGRQSEYLNSRFGVFADDLAEFHGAPACTPGPLAFDFRQSENHG